MDSVTERMARHQRERFALNVRHRSDQLRNLADALERIADKALTVDTPEYPGARDSNNLTVLAGEVVAEVVRALSLLSLDGLVDAGAQYEQIKRSGEGQ